jgi:methyl-accepting chemotaxis protein PixJ
VRALDNIYAAGMTSCYLEQLAKLEVQANLVTPILNEGKLFGLLVAHQCSAPRVWQQPEIRWVTQIATQVGFALDNAKLLAEATQLKQQTATEAQWTQLFTDAVRYIRQSLQQEDILDISVEEVRRVLNCDRVVVYSLNQERYGVVVAESVAPGWTRALGRTIQDPCFEARYLDQYRDGRVRALDNIYAAGMTSCYLEQLAQLEVQANLVTPILNEGKLFGLLVAHQCAAPRVWQQHEIRWVTQIATQVGFALDNSKLLRRIATEGRLTQSLKNFTLRLRERFNQKELLKIAVEEARRAINSDRVIVYSFDEHWQGTAIAESILPGLPKALGANINDPCFARDYAEKYRRGRIQTIDNIDEAELTDCYRQQLAKFAVKASLVAPIVQGDRLFGLLIAHQCSSPRHWQQAEVDLFAQLAVQVGLALDRAILLSGVTHATSQMLQESQNALENLSAEVNRQSEAIADFLKQVQAITNYDREITTTAAPAEYLERSSQTANLDSNQVTLKENIATVRETIAKAAEKVKQLKQSSEKLVQMGHLIDELRNQREGQGTDGASDLSQVKQSSQSSLVSFAETVYPLTHRLAKQTEQIEALMGEIALETNEVLDAPDSNTSQVFVEIEPTTPVNIEMNAIAGKIARATEQTQNLAFINQFILQIAALANQISAQSAAVTESFDKLAALTQKLPNDD